MEPPLDETLTQMGARLLREAKACQPAITAISERIFREMGIPGEPIGAEKVRQMMLDKGIKPEDNESSQDTIAHRGG